MLVRLDALENVRLRLPLAELIDGHGPVRHRSDPSATVRPAAGAELDQPIRIRIGQWPEHDGVDDGVDGRRGPYPERQRERGDDREAWRRAEAPGGVPQINYQIAHAF